MLLGAALGGPVRAGDKAPAPGILYQVDLNLNMGGKSGKYLYTPSGRPGDMWQFHLISPAGPKEKRVRTLRVEIEGESVALAAIVKVGVRRKDGEPDGSKVNVSCFIRAVKGSKTAESKSVVKITPVGEDGKDWPTMTFRMDVYPALGPEKKAPPVEPPPDPLPPIHGGSRQGLQGQTGPSGLAASAGWHATPSATRRPVFL
jgi:hypothetical protein